MSEIILRYLRDTDNAVLLSLDDDGNLVVLGSVAGTGNVSTVFGRNGAVVAVGTDYQHVDDVTVTDSNDVGMTVDTAAGTVTVLDALGQGLETDQAGDFVRIVGDDVRLNTGGSNVVLTNDIQIQASQDLVIDAKNVDMTAVGPAGGLAIGAGGAIGQIDDTGNEYLGVAGMSVFDCAATYADPIITDDLATSAVVSMSVEPTVDQTTALYTSLKVAGHVSPTCTKEVGNVVAIESFAGHFGSNTLDSQGGVVIDALVEGDGDVTVQVGCFVATGTDGISTGNIATSIGVEINTGAFATGVITNNIGMRVDSPLHNAQLTHNYGIYIQDQTVGGANNPDPWAIYVAGGKTRLTALRVNSLSVFANNAAAIGGGLAAGDFYRTGADPDVVCVVH